MKANDLENEAIVGSIHKIGLENVNKSSSCALWSHIFGLKVTGTSVNKRAWGWFVLVP